MHRTILQRCLPGLAAAVLVAGFAMPAAAAQCGNTSSGFQRWVQQFRQEAASEGFSPRTLDRAFDGISYRSRTIAADRGQHSFKLSLDAFMKKRGSATIVAKGKRLKRKYASLFSSIESRYGVPPGPLLAIWGMETGFGSFMGNDRAIPALATLAYDCRRSAFFTDQLYAALTLVQRGELAPSEMVSARHGELGQTQFLPTNYVKYAVDGDGNGRRDLIHSTADALASTANYLRAHGWRAGAGYQPGQANFSVLQSWNDASVYQRALAIMGSQIDGG
ncbi:lytic murein transglycosylase [Pararhizobium mangrovi]|uniref:Lytic murein transglycosylase n=1 Tax=Pararhizobium mangrovi TaxID=2590452 RepID=A0A506TYK9_9HYPH|nr:lytic murein transglycosylase [Pararhizobium mangrovi]TPW26071.1 lytic murein transglycosylase [Pararhizobium mangrovi]